MNEVRADHDRIFDRSMREPGGIDLKLDDQLQLLEELSHFYKEQPFQETPTPGMRFYFGNN